MAVSLTAGDRPHRRWLRLHNGVIPVVEQLLARGFGVVAAGKGADAHVELAVGVIALGGDSVTALAQRAHQHIGVFSMRDSGAAAEPEFCAAPAVSACASPSAAPCDCAGFCSAATGLACAPTCNEEAVCWLIGEAVCALRLPIA